MPFSDQQGKDIAVDWYRQIAPKTVVDVGAGAGTYARLMRPTWPGDMWTAIEAWEPYIDSFHLDDVYDQLPCKTIKALAKGYGITVDQ